MEHTIEILEITAPGRELNQLVALFTAYQVELGEDLCFQGFAAEIQSPLEKYTHKGGALFLAIWDQQPAGCIAFQSLPERGVCEMKRMFVPPAYRERGIGELLAQKAIETAQRRGYSTMVLDTLDRLEPAIRLYEKLGFSHTDPYYANPLLGVVYMQKDLGESKSQ
jgi:putative acetyltransferase